MIVTGISLYSQTVSYLSRQNDLSAEKAFILNEYNPLPDMPILGSSNLGANKDMMSETWTIRDTII